MELTANSSYKVLVIGSSGVGKTCLTHRFCKGRFPTEVESTIGVDFQEKTVKCGNEFIKLQFWDTAGQERFRKSMAHHYYRDAHAVVFVYDVTKPQSFKDLKKWIEECRMYEVPTDIPAVLVGNKCDLQLAQITTSEAMWFANLHNMALFEISAKKGKSDLVSQLFLTLAWKLKTTKSMMGCEDRLYNPSIKLASPTRTSKRMVDNSGCNCAC